MYQWYRDKLGVPSDVVILAESTEDETGIVSELVWCDRRDCVDGVCGLSGVGHKCEHTFEITVGDNDKSADLLVKAAEECQRGSLSII
jgi:hypothetical protein